MALRVLQSNVIEKLPDYDVHVQCTFISDLPNLILGIEHVIQQPLELISKAKLLSPSQSPSNSSSQPLSPTSPSTLRTYM
jgi:hypothetical protein